MPPLSLEKKESYMLTRIATSLFVPLLLTWILAAQVQEPPLIPEPAYVQQFNAVLGGQLTILERQTAVMDTKSRRNFVITPNTKVFESIANPASPLRVAPGTHFVVRMAMGDRDPQTLITLKKLVVGKKDRQIPIVTYKQSLIPFGGIQHNRAANDSISLTIRKYGTSSYEMVPQQALAAGEYCFMEGHTAQCFGVDASLSNSSQPPAPAAPTTATVPQTQSLPSEAPSAWQPTSPPYGTRKAGDSAVTLAVIATRGAKRGRAHLVITCTQDTFLAAYFTVEQPLIGYKVDNFNNVVMPGDSTPLGRLQIADGPETQLTLSGNTGEDNPVRLNISSASRNGLPDNFYTADTAGKPVKLTILPPDGKGPPTVGNFVLPADPAPMVGVASSCLLAQAREAAEAKAKVVASCPDKPGKALVDAKVRAFPGGRSFDYEPSDEGFGGGWDLSSPAVKAGQHAVLECIYAAPKTAPGSEPKVVAPANRMSISLPANAASCGMGGEPLEVTCSRK